ncbi:uncharacterized protein [Amphiura filiformis]|uniref:uncharacterized protein n=1 Tax=Amphiura filiformis TaxID=82378 RepID=UPI003B20DE8B
MPPKKGKGKKGKKKKKPKKPKGMLEDPGVVVKRLSKLYIDNCAKKKNVVCPGVKVMLKDCYENDRLIVKFILEPVPDFQDEVLSNVSLDTVVMTIRHERYKWVKEFHVWDIPLKHETVANLALMLETGIYPVIRIELVDCALVPFSIARIAQPLSLNTSLVTSLCLDYNEFGDEGVKGLCAGLASNKVMLSLSLCYCDLGVESGAMLGDLISKTAIREIYLNGNNLEAEGVIELIKMAVDHAEVESRERQEEASRKAAEAEALTLLQEKEKRERRGVISDTEKQDEEKPASAKSSKSGKKKKKKGKKKKGKTKDPPGPPPVGPLIYKLHVADNGIDAHGRGSTYAPVIAMRLFRTLIEHSMCLQEIDLDDNAIGDLGGREIMDGLKARGEADLPGIKMAVTHQMNSDTFASIVKLGAGLKKKKKKKGKKKKKKK